MKEKEQWLAYDWQNNLIGKFETEQKAWNFLDKADLSGNVIKEEKQKEGEQKWNYKTYKPNL